MSQVFTVQVTDADGKVKNHTAEVGGKRMTADDLQKHYDKFQGGPRTIHPFPGAKSIKVIGSSERDVPGRTAETRTPPPA